MLALGIDLSLSKTGIALVKILGPHENQLTSGRQLKLDSVPAHTVNTTQIGVLGTAWKIATDSLDLYDEIVPVFIERPIYRPTNRNAESYFQTGRLLGALEVHFERSLRKTNLVNPQEVKTFLELDKDQRKDKIHVVNAIRRRLGDDTFLEEETKAYREAVCDAIGIALTGVFMAY